jgi:hypothetical protein
MAISLRKKISTFLKLDLRTISALLSQKYDGYLKKVGWFESFTSGSVVDKNSQPIPWLSYPFISFISDRLTKTMNIFEFGSGNSTLYFSEKVNSVTSVEHDKDWYIKILSKKNNNVNLLFVQLETNGKYCRSALSGKSRFHIIIVDGEDRVNCIFNSLDSLERNGVIILDDSERNEYADGIDFLLKNSFKKIDFYGMAAGVLYEKCTSLFYKEDNCLNI